MMSHAWTPIYHPWFDKPSVKRKHTSLPDSDLSSNSSSSPPPTKRRRAADLEHGFANLTLDNANLTVNLDPVPTRFDLSPPPSPSWPDDLVMDADTNSASALTHHASAEESAPSLSSTKSPVRDVKMKSSSWYEPEPDRIVITSLDSSSSSEDEDEEEPEAVQISPALIKRLQARRLDQNVPLQQSQALVLFRPLTFDMPAPVSDKNDGHRVDRPAVLEEDPMDVES